MKNDTISKYILDSTRKVIPCDNLIKWATWFETADRKVGETVFKDSTISTIFLGMDHDFGFSNDGPVLWETLVFGGPLDGEMDRCSGEEINATDMHCRMVIRVRKSYTLLYKVKKFFINLWNFELFKKGVYPPMDLTPKYAEPEYLGVTNCTESYAFFPNWKNEKSVAIYREKNNSNGKYRHYIILDKGKKYIDSNAFEKDRKFVLI